MLQPVSYALNSNNYNKNLSLNGSYGLKCGTFLGIIPSTVTSFVANSGSIAFKPLISGIMVGIITCGIMGHIIEELSKGDNDDDVPPADNLDLQG